MDITTKMHIALAVMLTIYIVPLIYLVWLSRHEQVKPRTEPQVGKGGGRQ